MANQTLARFVPSDTGPSYWGRGDRYIFLATGAQTKGAYFLFEAIVPPGGGPPSHFHKREEEGFYILEGTLDFTMGDKHIMAKAGDFVQFPIGVVHAFRNTGSGTAKMLAFCTPAGLEKYFEEVLEPVRNRSAAPQPVTEAFIGKLLAGAPKVGVEYLPPPNTAPEPTPTAP